MYKQELDLPRSVRIYRDTSASSVTVGQFYYGIYHTLIVAPATSNAVAKFVYGISDDFITNVFAQAGKCRVPTLVFACDTAPELETEAPKGMVKVYPRPIDLENRERLGRFAGVTTVNSIAELQREQSRSDEAKSRHEGTHSVFDRPPRPEAVSRRSCRAWSRRRSTGRSSVWGSRLRR